MRKAGIKHPTVLSENLFPVVGIGASAGGLESFTMLVRAIPKDSGMAFILVQHLHPDHESVLAGILQKVSAIPIEEINDNVEVLPDHIYVIPPNKMLVANDGVLQLSPRANSGANLPIDIFFSSLADVHRSHAIGVVLAGNGADGTKGLKAIKDQGGLSFAQDPLTTDYPSMPRHAIDADLVDFVLPVDQIIHALVQMRRSSAISFSGNKSTTKSEIDDVHVQQIFALLKAEFGIDFSYYKQTTVRRRIDRQMAINKFEKIADYHLFLQKNYKYLEHLFRDLLIPVTAFFRDSSSFEFLCSKVLPAIIKKKPEGRLLRIWVAACSTGQEAYSIAICCQEHIRNLNLNLRVQIFATDVSPAAIQTARAGLYTTKETSSVSKELLAVFFTKTDTRYQVKKTIRDMCIFATHNFLKDPPFQKIDLASCRNVLIYLQPVLQKKAFGILHYSLNDHGILWLGRSETPGNASNLFLSFDKTEKFFIRRAVAGRFTNIGTELAETPPVGKPLDVFTADDREHFQRNADAVLLSKHTPAAVIINDQLDIVQFRGNTAEYLSPAPGKASLNVLRMAKDELSFELRNAIHQAKTSRISFSSENIPFNAGKTSVTLEVVPLKDSMNPYYLVLFHPPLATYINATAPVQGKKGGDQSSSDSDQRKQVISLQKELSLLRDNMRLITEEQESVNNDLQSSNEELLSGSEELQSLNEELESSKEELQSMNEELITVNQELNERNDELGHLRKFAESTVAILHEPLLVLDEYYEIITANAAFYKTFYLSPNETIGKVLFELQDNGWEIPGLRNQLQKIITQQKVLIETEKTFTFPFIGERTICFNIQPIKKENGDQLIVVALDDITLRKAHAQKKDDFISIASHEMKTPLTTAKSYLQLLEKSAYVQADPTARLYAEKASRSIIKLNNLIGDLLDVSKIQSGKLNYNMAEFDFDKMVTDTVDDLQHSLPAGTITKKGMVKKMVRGDADRLQQVLINLITNAIKYSPKDSPVEINTTFRSGFIKVAVKDQGIGIAVENIKNIFSKYYRVAETANYSQGLGIGLFIAYEIITRHQGKIWVESSDGKGCTFFFTIPLLAKQEE
ncbi:MAG: signal transduction histidine kinase with CheB and CheR [Ferruginibacter sp.]|nr:signal transduction histidine kinase with CheB and CheR [Ferruginibacter sp.]